MPKVIVYGICCEPVSNRYVDVYKPVTVEAMRRTVIERGQLPVSPRYRIAVVLGPAFPAEIRELLRLFAFAKEVEVAYFSCLDLRAEPVEGGSYIGAPAGVIVSGGKGQPLFFLRPEVACDFSCIYAVNFFPYHKGGGIVSMMGCKGEDVGLVLRRGPHGW